MDNPFRPTVIQKNIGVRLTVTQKAKGARLAATWKRTSPLEVPKRTQNQTMGMMSGLTTEHPTLRKTWNQSRTRK